ncbi:MAG: hypothetical protein FWB78_12590 [Treponema sp.]|nr:hypothetical protein [Treponema sp.]
MKKYLFSLLIFFAGFSLYGQSSDRVNQLRPLVNQAIDLLGSRTIPEGFERADRTLFARHTTNGISVVLTVENGIIILIQVGSAFRTTSEASSFRAAFFDLFEEMGAHLRTYSDGELYRIRNTEAFIQNISRREDGRIIAVANFIRSD